MTDESIPGVSEPDEAEQAALAVLATSAGDWDAELEITPFPGADPERTKGVATNRMVGGRWLVSDIRTESGFEGHGIYGWDPATGSYIATWVDVAGGGMGRATGTWDEASGTMTYDFEVAHQGQTLRYREATRTVDDTTKTYSNVVPTPDGGEHEMIKATYRRRPG
jgi:hypothetical protein